MPLIDFDPPSENSSQYGGALDDSTRVQYIELCKQMTSRNPSLDYAHIRDAILTILEKDVRAHVQTLPESDRAKLIGDIDIIFSNIDRTDENYLATINIVSVQVSILFTQYVFGFTPTNIAPFIFSYDAYENIIGEDWKNYSVMKRLISNDDTEDSMKMLVQQKMPYETPEEPIFMAFIGFMKLSELNESSLNNIIYVGLSYTAEWVDGSWFYPFAYLKHDLFHYGMYIESCPNFPNIINGFKQFRNYVVSTQDKSTQYSIDFVLFLFLHEEPYCSTFKEDTIENNLQNKSTPKTIFKHLINNIDELMDLHDFGKAIPTKYRELIEGSDNLLNEEKIQEYLRIVAESYVVCWNQFRNRGFKGGYKKSGSRKHFTRRKQRKQSRKVMRKTKSRHTVDE